MWCLSIESAPALHKQPSLSTVMPSGEPCSPPNWRHSRCGPSVPPASTSLPDPARFEPPSTTKFELSKFRSSKNHIDLALLRNAVVEPVKVIKVGDVGLYADDLLADLGDGVA